MSRTASRISIVTTLVVLALATAFILVAAQPQAKAADPEAQAADVAAAPLADISLCFVEPTYGREYVGLVEGRGTLSCMPNFRGSVTPQLQLFECTSVTLGLWCNEWTQLPAVSEVCQSSGPGQHACPPGLAWSVPVPSGWYFIRHLWAVEGQALGPNYRDSRTLYVP
jgi:hypothetical protein